MVARPRTKPRITAMPPDWAGPQFELLFESSVDGILIYDWPSRTSRGRTRQGNDALCRILGYSLAEILQIPVTDLFTPTPDPRSQASQQILRARDGHGVEVEITTRKFVYRRQRMGMSIIRNISERTGAEAAIRESAEKYRELLNHALTGMYEVDFRTQRFISVNDSMCQLLGYTREELLAMTPSDILDEQGKNLFKRRIAQWMAGETPDQNVEYTVRTRDGRLLSAILNVTFTKDSAGKPLGATVVGYDVSDRKRAEEALRQSETRLRLAQVAVGAGVWDWDLESGRIEWSKELFQLFGLDPDRSAAGFEGWRSALHPEDRTGAEKRIEDAIKNQTPLTSEYRIVLPSGEVRWINALGSVSCDDTGKPVRMSGICLDITDRKRAEQALQASQEQYRHLVEGSGSVILRSDENMNITFMNRYGLDFFGYTAEELIGRNAVGTIIPIKDEAGHDLTEMARDLRRNPNHYATNAHQNRRKDGSLVWMSWANKAFYDEKGHLVEILAIGNDLSGAKEAERAARESQAKLEAALASMSDAVLITDGEGQPVDINEAFVGFYRFKSKDESLKTIFEHPDIFDAHLPDGTPVPPEKWAVPRALAGETATNNEITLRRTDTGETWVGSYSFGPIRDKDGRIVGSVVVGRDITDRKRAEEVLRRSEEARKVGEALHAERQRLFDMLETLPTMISLLTPDQRVAFANRSFRENFGEPAGRPCYECCFGRSEPCPGCETATVLETGQPHHWERAHPNGRVVDIYDFPFTDVDGAPMILKMEVDITSHRETERELRSAHADLAARAAQLRALAGELTLTEQRERRRMAKLLHDHLQQLLVGAKFRTVILGRSGDDIAKQAAGEIEHLLDESISVSRSLTAELSPPILYEGGLPAGLQWLARWVADKYGLIVDLSVAEDLPSLQEDIRILLFESVRELLFNAVKHAHARSVTVNVRQIEGQLIQITVSDQGPGFEPAKLKKAGEIGGGFGLFGIRERLNLIGGKMEIDSAPGKGSRFTLTAPWDGIEKRAPSVAATAPQRIAWAQGDEVRSPKLDAPIRVLLADDHKVTREGLRRLLDAEPDLLVVAEAADGEEAVELAQTLSPEVILMDLRMPGLNGVEATRMIHNHYPDIRIIGLSMFAEEERAQALRDAGAVNYLTKSGPSRDLIAAIRSSIHRRVSGD